MERNNNLSFFIIISFALHLSLALLLRMDVLKPAIKGEDTSTEVELLTMPRTGIIGDMPTKLQQFSSGRESGGQKVSANSVERRSAPPVQRGGDEVRIANKPLKRPTPSDAEPKPRENRLPSETTAPVENAPAPSPAPPAPAPAPQAAPAPPPMATERHPLPPPPTVPLFRDEKDKKEGQNDEKTLDFPRLKVPFINEKDLEKFAKAEPKPVLPERNKGMSLDLEQLKYERYYISIAEDLVKGLTTALDNMERTSSKSSRANLSKLDGSVLVYVYIAKDGSAKEIRLERSSGHLALDELAMATAQNAGPFHPIPDNIGTSEFLFRIQFIFNRGNRGVYWR